MACTTGGAVGSTRWAGGGGEKQGDGVKAGLEERAEVLAPADADGAATSPGEVLDPPQTLSPCSSHTTPSTKWIFEPPPPRRRIELTDGAASWREMAISMVPRQRYDHAGRCYRLDPCHWRPSSS